MTALVDDIVQAVKGSVPQNCPIKEKPESGSVTRELPDKAKKLVPVWQQRVQAAVKLISEGPSGNDGGVWFRRQNEADAVKTLIDDVVRKEFKLSRRAQIVLYSDWKCFVNGE